MLFNVIIGLSLLLNQATLIPGNDIIQTNQEIVKSSNTDPFAADSPNKTIPPKKNINSTIVDSFIFKKNFDNLYSLPLESISLPMAKKEVERIVIDSESAIAVDLVSGKVLYEKNPTSSLPIASLTKLVSALVVIDNVKNLDDLVEVSANAVKTEGESGKLVAGEKLSVKNLLYLMLVPSSNDAAVALAEYTGGNSQAQNYNTNPDSKVKIFVDLMNDKAEALSLKNTHFSNPAGISSEGNFSSAEDIVRIMRYLFNDSNDEQKESLQGKKLIREIIKTSQITVYSKDKVNAHSVRSTNKLLGVLPNIVGGKTGYTEDAGESLVLVTSDASKRHFIVTVVLDAKDRFEQSKKLIDWVFNSYSWRD